MKTTIAIISLLASLSSFASVLTCNEKYDIRQEVLKPRYSVKITELKDITRQSPEGKEFDAVRTVRVDLVERFGSRVTTQTIQGIALEADVNYFVKAPNFNFSTFLDELDDSGLTIVKAGRKVTIPMICNIRHIPVR